MARVGLAASVSENRGTLLGWVSMNLLRPISTWWAVPPDKVKDQPRKPNNDSKQMLGSVP